MSTMCLNSLVAKLSAEARKTLESAAAKCHSRTHFSVEIAHWLLTMCEQPAQDIEVLVSYFNVDLDKLKSDLNLYLESGKSGHDQAPALSPQLVAILRSSWMSATIEFEAQQISHIHIIHALMTDNSVSPFSHSYLSELEKIDSSELVALSNEVPKSSAVVASTNTGTPNLDQYTTDLTGKARANQLDPILGRDDEIRQMIDVLTRRRQNNPILTGEAGVGKTAVVEGLAQRIVQKEVPQSLLSVSIRELDLALLQAGAGMKGEFENRLKSLIKEVKNSTTPIILFVDEAHTLIGSGGQAGQNDAANLLKPALARGELRTIAATTWSEYKKYFEKDAALTRRFQVVNVAEPSEDKAIIMMRGLLPVMEAHHQVTINDDALQAAVRLSNRYINGRQLPDKAVSVLDTACARVAMSQVATPTQVERLQRRHEHLSAHIAQLEKEQKIGAANQQALDTMQSELTEIAVWLAKAEQTWHSEQELVANAKRNIEEILLSDQQPSDDDEFKLGTSQTQLKELRATLSETSAPMVFLDVDETLVAEVISDWTGIPLGRMQNDEMQTILDLPTHLGERIVGQDHALNLVSKVVQTARAHLSDENKPNGVFMFTGPSGTGKTETALAVAELVYGSEDNLTVINMSEFKEEHKVSLLVGSPPGYVGYGEGGVLTEAVRRKPYSVILLDEMEKAHPGVQDVFYQVFDKGMIKDGEGRDIDFKNTIIIMTSNVGTDTTLALCDDVATSPDAKGLKEALNNDLLEAFKPAFLGRINIIPYFPLDEISINNITQLQFNRIIKRFSNQYQAELKFDDTVYRQISSLSQNKDVGARAIYNNIQNEILPILSSEIIDQLSKGKKISNMIVIFQDEQYQLR